MRIKGYLMSALVTGIMFGSVISPQISHAAVTQPNNFPTILSESAGDPVEIAPGAVHQKINLTTPNGPLQLNTINIDTSNPNIGFKAVMAQDKIVTYKGETVSSMASRTGAVAGINSDYFDISNTMAALNLTVSDGELLRSPYIWAAFAIDQQNRPSIQKFTWQGNIEIPTTPENDAVWAASGKTKPADQKADLDSFNWFAWQEGLYLYNNKVGIEYPVYNGSYARVNVLLEKDADGSYVVTKITENEKRPELADNQMMLIGHGTRTAWLLEHMLVGLKLQINLTTLPDWRNFKQVIGGGPILLKDGQLYNDPESPAADERDIRYPVVGIGIAPDGKTMQMALFDGRQNSLSIGVTRPEFGEYFKALGMKDAMAFDSGGSAEMVARMPGDTAVTVVNSPSDGFERKVANGFFVYNTAVPSGLSKLVLNAPYKKVYKGSSMTIDVKGIDENKQPVAVDQSSVVLSTTVPGASVNNRLFIAGSQPGTGVIKGESGSVTGELPVEVVDTLGKLDLKPNPAIIAPGLSQQFTVEARDQEGRPVQFSPVLGTWSVEGPIGTIDSNGLFQASTQPGEGTVSVEAGGVKATVKVNVGKPPIIIDDFDSNESLSKWSSNAVRSTTQFSLSSRPNPVHKGTHSLQIDYDFTVGPDGTAASYALPDTATGGRFIEDRPMHIGMWIYGDGHAHWLRSIVTDGLGTNNTIDITPPSGFNWIGWKYVTIPIAPSTPLPIKLKQIYLVETNNQKKDKGTFYIDDIRAVYYDMGEDLTGPTIKNVSPTGGSTVYSARPTITAVVDDDKSGVDSNSIEMRIDGQLVTPQYGAATKQLSYSPADNLNDGVHKVMINAFDKAGNEALPKAEFSFTVYTGPDMDAPVISPISPLDGTVTNTQKPRIAVKLTDAYTGVDFAATKLLIDSQEMAYRVDESSNTIYYTPAADFELNSRHEISVTVPDKSGNTAVLSWSFQAGNSIGQPQNPDHFQMSVIGDGGYYTAGQTGTAADVLLKEQIARINNEPSELVGYTGDLVENDTEANFLTAKQVMDAFNKPYLVTIGNHEVSGTNSRANFQKVFGDPVYAHDYGNLRIITVDAGSGTPSASDASQWDWLSHMLNETKESNIAVFMHTPPDEISADGVDFKTGHGFQNPNEAQRFYDLLGSFKSANPDKNVVVFSGDLHAYEHKIVQGVDYVITGGGGKLTHVTPEQGGFYHYLNLKVDGNHLSWDVVPLLDSITIGEVPAYVKKGEQVKLKASGNFMTSSNAPITMPIQAPFKRDWVSSNPEVASVDTDGTVTGKAPGQAVITVKSGGKEAQATIVIPTPPKTTVTADGVSGPGTFNNRDVVLTFSAVDGSAGSGVKQTSYRVDSAAWNAATGPVSLTDEGVHTVDYFSEDNLGNQEDVQQLIIGIDKTAPTIALTANGKPVADGMEFLDSESIKLALQASDNLSGVAEQTLIVDGKPYVAGTAMDWAGQLGSHVIQAVVKDGAGNISESVIKLNINTSIPAMKRLVDRYFASGELSLSYKKKLLELLKDAEQHLHEGNYQDATDDMKDFQKKINTPDKKKNISDRAKAALNADAKALIQSWAGKANDQHQKGNHK